MEQSESINELATALAKAQAEMHGAAKDAVNKGFNSSYATLASVWDACRIPLSTHGLSVVQLPTTTEAGRVSLLTMLMHTSGQFIRETVSTKIMKDDPQGVGSGITYLRRYALSAIVGIAADDDDGNAASNTGSAQPRQQPARPQQKPPAPPVGKDIDNKALFLNGLAEAVEGRGQVDQAATTAKALAALAEKAKGMTPDTVTPKVGNALIAAVIDGKYDVPLTTNKSEAA